MDLWSGFELGGRVEGVAIGIAPAETVPGTAPPEACDVTGDGIIPGGAAGMAAVLLGWLGRFLCAADDVIAFDCASNV